MDHDFEGWKIIEEPMEAGASLVLDTYAVRGEDRQINAQGVLEAFIILVDAPGADEAKQLAIIERGKTRQDVAIFDATLWEE